jgi:hypothetical protein
VTRTRMVALLAGAVLLAATPVAAQRWGRERRPQAGACFYEDSNYRGDYFCVRLGDSLSSLPDGMNDRISSVQVFGRGEVVIFQDHRFRGRSRRIDRDVRNLKSEGWNDRISSLRVSVTWEESERIVRRAYRDVLDRDPDQAGLKLYRGRIVDDGWSEGQVRDALRQSPEYRQKNTMTRQKAEDIVRAAYLSVLHREPDAGSRGYVDRVLRDKWTQGDVERELRKSPEYRRR